MLGDAVLERERLRVVRRIARRRVEVEAPGPQASRVARAEQVRDAAQPRPAADDAAVDDVVDLVRSTERVERVEPLSPGRV